MYLPRLGQSPHSSIFLEGRKSFAGLFSQSESRCIFSAAVKDGKVQFCEVNLLPSRCVYVCGKGFSTGNTNNYSTYMAP